MADTSFADAKSIALNIAQVLGEKGRKAFQGSMKRERSAVGKGPTTLSVTSNAAPVSSLASSVRCPRRI